MKATNNIDAWKVLAALSEGRGMKGASISTGLDLPACTRIIQKLEEDLGLALIDHESRPARLTKGAEALLPAVRSLLESHARLQAGAAVLRGESISASLSIPVNCPRESVNAILKSFAGRDPGLSIEIVSDFDHEDVLEGRVDIAYLPYEPPAAGLLLWKVGAAFNLPLASREYLRRRGEPKCPEDLASHSVILRKARHYDFTETLVRGAESRPLKCRRVAFAGDVMSGREALLKGDGIALDLSISSCLKDIESGALVPVLGGWHRPAWRMTLAAPARARHSPRLLRFAEWFAEAEGKALLERMRRYAAMFPLFERASV
jgi:DNA-binding transcriptional LysR family regulator